jgi:hypothetical protein
MTIKHHLAAACVLILSWMAPEAQAEATVECHSRHYQYGECWAGPLKQPQLIHQISSNPCTLNRTWGYNPQSGYIWVAEGCSGVFADVGGYHHGRGDGFDSNARMYDHRGNDVGAVVAGAVLGALLEGMTDDHKAKRRHTTSNYAPSDDYNGCHGVGCLVDNPDEVVDDRPQFDKNGEPNFDTDGNYQGCHGLGCLVDDPTEQND